MKLKTTLLAAACAAFLSASSASAAFELTQNGDQYTFTFLPTQTAPLPTGFASYTSGNIIDFRGIFWSGAEQIISGATIISNSLIDDSGASIPNSTVPFPIIVPSTKWLAGFANNTSTDFTVAGGSLTYEITSGVVFPSSPETISGFDFGTTYDPGTTGTNGDLTAVPEPSTYAAIAGALCIGLALWRKRKTQD